MSAKAPHAGVAMNSSAALVKRTRIAADDDAAVLASGRPRRRHLILTLVLLTIALSAIVRFADLAASPRYVADENYYARDAAALLHDGFGTLGVESWMPGLAQSFAHPELGVEAIAAGIAVLGDGPWGWRAPSALAGTLLIALVYPLSRRMRLPPVWALAATVLAAGDTLLIIQSRLAMLDIFVALGSVTCVYLAIRAVQAPRAHFAAWVTMCGLAGGAATACKWSGGLAVVAALLILALDRRLLGTRRMAVAAIGIVALTGAVYIVSYAPYFAAGHNVEQWLRLQRFMVSYNWQVRPAPAQSSLAISWPFDVYPIWYQWSPAEVGLSRGLLAIGNPLLWWASVAAFVVLGAQAAARRDARLAVVPLMVAVFYAPWLVTSRPAFLYYMTPVVPFLAILVATALWRLCTPAAEDVRPGAVAFPGGLLLTAGAFGVAGLGEGWGGSTSVSLAARVATACAGTVVLATAVLIAARCDPRRPAVVSAAAWAYVGATTGLAVAFLPFLLGYPVTVDYYRYLMWLPTWW